MCSNQLHDDDTDGNTQLELLMTFAHSLRYLFIYLRSPSSRECVRARARILHSLYACCAVLSYSQFTLDGCAVVSECVCRPFIHSFRHPVTHFAHIEWASRNAGPGRHKYAHRIKHHLAHIKHYYYFHYKYVVFLLWSDKLPADNFNCTTVRMIARETCKCNCAVPRNSWDSHATEHTYWIRIITELNHEMGEGSFLHLLSKKFNKMIQWQRREDQCRVYGNDTFLYRQQPPN